MEFNALTTNHVKLGQDLEINLDRIYYSRLNTRSIEKKRNINHARIKTSEMTRCSILISRVVLQGVVNLHIFFITWKRSNSDNLREQEEEAHAHAATISKALLWLDSTFFLSTSWILNEGENSDNLGEC